MAEPPHPDETVRGWADRFAPVPTEQVPLGQAAGRILAEVVRADRDSPAHDVSAMDGFAVRVSDFDDAGRLPIAGEVVTGTAPPELPPGHGLRIFTGGCVPPGADLVIKREDTAETRELIELQVARESLKPGRHIRRRGENAKAGDVIVQPGIAVTPAIIGAAASFGLAELTVYRRVRVGLLITGDELLPQGVAPQPWQIRDSNGPVLSALLASATWCEVASMAHGGDDPDEMGKQLQALMEDCDTVVTTGGVSMGDHDYIPAVIKNTGGDIVFHKLPVRPGKPMLGAKGPDGHPILGLPGNPVSAMATLRRFGIAALRRLAGFSDALPEPVQVTLDPPDDQSIGLWWYRLVRLTGDGGANLVATRGSGDVASVAQSDGVVEVRPGTMADGTLPFYPWQLG